MVGWIKSVMQTLGYPGIAFLMFLENVFPPIPSELIMPLAGFVSEVGNLSFLGVVIAGMVGSVLGAVPLYYLGYYVGRRRMVALADRYGYWLTISGEDILRAAAWFHRHGGAAVFFCRFVPGIRSLISIPAGFAKMNMALFLLYTAVGTGLWAALLAWLGRLLGANYQKVGQYLGPVSYVVLGLLAICFIVWVLRRRRRRKKPETRGQRSEIRSQRSEVGTQKPEGGNQRPEP